MLGQRNPARSRWQIFMQRYEILKLVGGFGLALAPHGEITNVFDHRYQAEIALIAAEQGYEDLPSVWIVDGEIIRDGFLSVLSGVPSEPLLPEEEGLILSRQQFDSLHRMYKRHAEKGA